MPTLLRSIRTAIDETAAVSTVDEEVAEVRSHVPEEHRAEYDEIMVYAVGFSGEVTQFGMAGLPPPFNPRGGGGGGWGGGYRPPVAMTRKVQPPDGSLRSLANAQSRITSKPKPGSQASPMAASRPANSVRMRAPSRNGAPVPTTMR